MLATLIDLSLAEKGLTRRCFLDQLGVRDLELTLSRLETLLQTGIQNSDWLEYLAQVLDLDLVELERANEITLLLHNTPRLLTHDPSASLPVPVPFKAYIELQLKDGSALTKFHCAVATQERDITYAKQVYLQAKSELTEAHAQEVTGFDYFWAEGRGVRVLDSGSISTIFTHQVPNNSVKPVSARLLRAVGKPQLHVIRGSQTALTPKPIGNAELTEKT